jgi:hypothetical protein
MDLIPIRDYIADQEPFYIEGESLFISHMPAQIEVGALLTLETSGAQVDHEITGVFKQRIQTIVRHPSFAEGYAMSRALFDMLNLAETQIGDYHFYYIRPRHLPIYYRRGDGDQLEFSVNYDTHFAEC